MARPIHSVRSPISSREVQSNGFLVACDGQLWHRLHAEEDRQHEGISSQQNPSSPQARVGGEEQDLAGKCNRRNSANYAGKHQRPKRNHGQSCTMRRGREQLRVLGRTADFGAVPVSANAGMGRWLFPRFPKQVTERIEVMTTDLYAANASWAQLPEGWSFTEVVGVATDSRDRVFVFSRSEHPVTIFGRDGQFVDSWGEGEFVRPHGLHIGPDDSVYCCDDQDHTVRKYTADGKLLLKLGVSGQASDTGATTTDYRDIKRVGPPFNQPTNLALSPDGEMYITDGYGNARVHKFSADGQLLYSWGEPGDGPGQFHLPHGIAVDPKARST